VELRAEIGRVTGRHCLGGIVPALALHRYLLRCALADALIAEFEDAAERLRLAVGGASMDHPTMARGSVVYARARCCGY